MTSQYTVRKIAVCLGLALAGWLVVADSARAQLHLRPEASDPSRPITVGGKEVYAWTEGNTQVMLLRGGARVEQGLLRVSMDQAVVWMDAARSGQDKPLALAIYGDGDVTVDRGKGATPEKKVFLELRTTEEVKLQNHKQVLENQAHDAYYRQALTERQAILEQTSARLTPPELPDGTVIQPVAANTGVPAAKVRTIDVIPTQLTPPVQNPAEPIPAPGPRPRRVQLVPRGSSGYKAETSEIAGEQVIVVTGGVAIFVEDIDGIGLVDISTDRAVLWTRRIDGEKFLTDLQRGETTREQVELYLEGHVEIRQATVRGEYAGITRLLTADQVYYNVPRNTAILVNAEIITTQPKLPESIHLRATEIRQLAANRFEASCATLFASRLPSDPDLTVKAGEASIEERKVPARNIFGQPMTDPKTGQPILVTQLWARADDLTLRLRDVPFFYLPRVQGDLRDPLGPLEQFSFRSDRVFGTGPLITWDIFQLIGSEPPTNTTWTLETDYMSRRGPALGTQFMTKGTNLFGLPGVYGTELLGYAIHDEAPTDILGGPREFPINEPWRGRFLARHRQEIGPEFTLLTQVSYLHDRNFLEQYYKREFDNDINQETFVYFKQQVDNWAWSINIQPHIRPWVTEASWLPRGDGYATGWSFFDRFTYFAHASAGYAMFYPTSDIPESYFSVPIPNEFQRFRPLPPSSDFPHNPELNTARLDLIQEIDLPFEVGPFKIVPYGVFDITYYSQTLAEEDGDTRLYGGGGVRASLPFTRIYPDVCSQMFNVHGIAHKIVFDADYSYLESNIGFRELPLLDRLDDDATDQARRDLRAFRLQSYLPGSNQYLLATSPIYDPQLYALRRRVMTSIDNLDSVQALEVGVRQRWQTKRGFPGREHILDWMTLNLEATYFPNADRDNFGHPFAFLQYDYTWHMGDRTTLVSTGWVDPFENGPRFFTLGVWVNRPERLQYYFGFRQIDPVGSSAMIVSTQYTFSPKWSWRFSTTYDFGDSQNLGNSLVLTRTGSDLQVSLGFTYQPLQNNFGVVLEVFPTLASSTLGRRGLPLMGGGSNGLVGGSGMFGN